MHYWLLQILLNSFFHDEIYITSYFVEQMICQSGRWAFQANGSRLIKIEMFGYGQLLSSLEQAMIFLWHTLLLILTRE